VSVPRDADRDPPKGGVALVDAGLVGVARLEVDRLTGAHLDVLGVGVGLRSDLERRGALDNVEQFFLIVVGMETAGEGLARSEVEDRRRKAHCFDLPRERPAISVRVHEVWYRLDFVDRDLLYGVQSHARMDAKRSAGGDGRVSCSSIQEENC
jgi:hypothetical protein